MMVPLVPRSNKTKNKKEGMQAPLMLGLRDGVHLHQEQHTKIGGAETPCLSIFGDSAQLRP
jgi:hypothetical protein